MWKSKFRAKPGSDPNLDPPYFGACSFLLKGKRWTLDQFLGSGSYGQTYMATYEMSGRRYVIKFLSQKHDRELDFFESIPFSVLQHPNVLTVIGHAVWGL